MRRMKHDFRGRTKRNMRDTEIFRGRVDRRQRLGLTDELRMGIIVG